MKKMVIALAAMAVIGMGVAVADDTHPECGVAGFVAGAATIVGTGGNIPVAQAASVVPYAACEYLSN